MRSHLLQGTVRHRRARPFIYALKHDVSYIALDLDEIDEVARRHMLISRNRANILAFRDADHMDPPAIDLRQGVHERLRSEGIDAEGWQITLVTNLRVFGYVFNPASFYLCRDAAGILQIVMVEVHNTHLERHIYTLRPATDGAAFVASMDKDFYVSPFIEMEGRYTVRVRDEANRLRISINEDQESEHLLSTSVDLARRPLSNRNIARMLLRYPFVTQKTIGLIHLHALRLWRRGARFHRHGAVVR